MSKAGYCATHGLNLSSFRYWLRKSRSTPDDIPLVPPAIVPLPFTLAPKAPSIGLLVGNRYAQDISRNEYLSERTYSYHRAKILGEGGTVFNKVLASITKRLELDAALQRTNSTMVTTQTAG